MTYIQLGQSLNFETVMNNACQQFGSFVLITTSNPNSTEDRLNKGWVYPGGHRKGASTPPLGLCDDWKVHHTWSVVAGQGLITTTVEVKAMFDRPCIISAIEKRLMDHDKELFPHILRKGMSKNGLDNVFCLKRDSYPTREEAGSKSGVEYQGLLTKVIIERVQMVIGELGIEEPVTAEKEGEADVRQG